MTDRRTFVKDLAWGAGSISALGAFLPARAVFGREFGRLGLRDRTSSSFAGLRDDYMLGSDVTYLNMLP